MMLNRWEILKRDHEGNRYEMRIRLSGDRLLVDEVGFIAKRKRNPVYLASELQDDYSYRQQDAKGKRKMKREKILSIVPRELIEESLKEVWESLQPKEMEFF